MKENFNGYTDNNSFAQANDEPQGKASVMMIMNIPTKNLEDSPDNIEDVSNTSDLELSIQQNGFLDPLDVTDFGMEEGKYMIVSGHRRRIAGENLGMDIFPCILWHFDSREEMINQMLLSQSFRDSSKDPLLYARRYKRHELFLKSIGFKGSYREEIAKRLGLSTQQADRYKNFEKLIQPVWDAVENGSLTISAVQPMASLTASDQAEIMNIIYEVLTSCESLTIWQLKEIVDGYKAGARTYAEVKEMAQKSKTEYEMPNTDYTQHPDMPSDLSDKKSQPEEKVSDSDRQRHEDYLEIDIEDNKTKAETELRQKHTDAVLRALATIEQVLQEAYECKNDEEAAMLINAYLRVINDLIMKMSDLIAIENMPSKWTEVSADIRETLTSCDELQQ